MSVDGFDEVETEKSNPMVLIVGVVIVGIVFWLFTRRNSGQGTGTGNRAGNGGAPQKGDRIGNTIIDGPPQCVPNIGFSGKDGFPNWPLMGFSNLTDYCASYLTGGGLLADAGVVVGCAADGFCMWDRPRQIVESSISSS